MTSLLLGALGFAVCLACFIAGFTVCRRYSGIPPNAARPGEDRLRMQKEFEEACSNLIGYSVEKAYERQSN